MSILENYSAKVLPAAPRTWETSALLLGAVQQTELISVPFPGPVELLGILPTVIVAGAIVGAPLRIPTTDDIAIQLDLNSGDRMTNRLSLSAPGGNNSFVTLSTLSAEKRWLRIVASNASPDFAMAFRWKPSVAGGAIYEDALISIAFLFRFLRSEN